MTDVKSKSESPIRVSVVIPAYNEEKNIDKCLRALSAQTKKPNEIIVANNNSSDKTPLIAREHGARVILATQRGYVFTLRKGMDSAKSEIVAVVDADTIVATDWVEMLARVFTDEEVVGVTGSVAIKKKSPFSKLNSALFNNFLFINFKLGKPHLVGFNFAVRKSALDKVGGLNTGYEMGPDVELGLRLKDVGKVVYAKDMIVYPSMRRYEENWLKALIEYTKSYLFTVWLKRPASVKQKVIR